ncbi:hypothetical protein [Marinomonas sp. THO17]|uniref:hypothetical protein n=1 Tax=Marinomonas sp. THO17 TaxID=3149048 RepID=UPI00336BCA31
MDTIEIIRDSLKTVVYGEHGKWLEENKKDTELGYGVFLCDRFSITLCLYTKGLYYKSESADSAKELKITYDDINLVESSLTLDKYSEASRTGNYFQLIPMILKCSSGLYELMVPLIVYSGVLVSLCECSKEI